LLLELYTVGGRWAAFLQEFLLCGMPSFHDAVMKVGCGVKGPH
jgi:hypothetical protein